MTMDFWLEGKDELQKKYDEIEEATGDPDGYLGAAIQERGWAIMADAVKSAPVDTGRLQASGYVGPPSRDSQGIFVEIGFATEYALAVHETHPTNANYLRDAIDKHKQDWIQQLAKAMEHFAETGTKMPITKEEDRLSDTKRKAYQQGLAERDS